MVNSNVTKFIEIECVEKKGSLIVGVFGTIAPQSSDQKPTKARFRAVNEAKGPLWYRFPDGREKLIRFITMNDTNCFFLEGDQLGENLLGEFPECPVELN